MVVLYIASGFFIGAFGPSDFDRMVPDKYNRGVQQETKDILGMFGDDPDPSVTTTRFGSGEVFGRARGICGMCREVRQPGKRETKSGWSQNGQRRQGERGNYEQLQVL